MKTVRVIALQDHIYDGIPRKLGELYDVQAKDVMILSAVGHVKTEAESVAPKRNEYRRRDLLAEK